MAEEFLDRPRRQYPSLDALADHYYKILRGLLQDEGLVHRWEVLPGPPGAFLLPSGSPEAGSDGLLYDHSITEAATVNFQLPHGYEEETPLRARAIVAPTSADSGTAIFRLTASYANPGSTLTAWASQDLTLSAGGAGKTQALDFASLSASLQIGALITAELKRIVGSDTYPADAKVMWLDLLIRRTTKGSQLERSKYQTGPDQT